jgi:hypothetical protein
VVPPIREPIRDGLALIKRLVEREEWRRYVGIANISRVGGVKENVGEKTGFSRLE